MAVEPGLEPRQGLELVPVLVPVRRRTLGSTPQSKELRDTSSVYTIYNLLRFLNYKAD